MEQVPGKIPQRLNMSFFPLIRAAKAEAAAVGSDGSSWSRRQQLGGHGVVDEDFGPGVQYFTEVPAFLVNCLAADAIGVSRSRVVCA